jgi:hypothetical protein
MSKKLEQVTTGTMAHPAFFGKLLYKRTNMRSLLTIFSLLLITCTQLKAQDVKKKVEAARNNPSASQDAGKADALQQKQIRQQNLSYDSTAVAAKPAAVVPKKSKKHCGKPIGNKQ